ncbi:MAG: hypothetical protein HYW25_03895 [Candidatus Aenigmarchaeota archaeon]|nr:hypothetical protein [Candidatus Aenigmarchaeota archaeon]
MDEGLKFYLLGAGFMAAVLATYYAGLYAVHRYRKYRRERRELMSEYERMFGFSPPEHLSPRDVRRELEIHSSVKD